MKGVQNFKTVDPEPNPFTKKELARMHECKNVCTQGQNAAMLNLLTGLRISELIALSWQDINWEREVLYVRRA
ncbi:tyrosine-type recombinase/integrase, partial [Escherichia coli]|nr:tyrosine-type recombinase/integrase [Escherichia coli]